MQQRPPAPAPACHRPLPRGLQRVRQAAARVRRPHFARPPSSPALTPIRGARRRRAPSARGGLEAKAAQQTTATMTEDCSPVLQLHCHLTAVADLLGPCRGRPSLNLVVGCCKLALVAQDVLVPSANVLPSPTRCKCLGMMPMLFFMSFEPNLLCQTSANLCPSDVVCVLFLLCTPCPSSLSFAVLCCRPSPALLRAELHL